MTALYGYQATGVQWLVKGHARCMLADAPGLGKSRQVLEAARLVAPGADLLIVCPKSVAGSWVEQVAAWRPDCLVSDDAAGLVRRAQDVARVGLAAGDAPVVVVTWPQALVRNPGWPLGAYPRGLIVIVDEPHEHRSLHSKWVHALASWTRLAVRVWGVDGTPVFNRVDDLYVVLCMLGCAPPHGLFTTWARTGVLRSQLAATGVLLRRELIEVEGDMCLPPMSRTLVRAPLPRECFQDPAWREARTASAIRVCASRHKWRLLKLLLDGGRLSTDVPTLLWHVHKAGARETAAQLVALTGARIGLVTGDMTAARREDKFAAFRAGDVAWLVLTQCAQAGVQLQRARVSVNVEMQYETKARAQAAARMCRLGQTARTQEITLAWEHDVDQHVLIACAHKETEITKAGF